RRPRRSLRSSSRSRTEPMRTVFGGRARQILFSLVLFVSVIAALRAALLARQAVSPPRTSIILGRVVDGATNTPVAGAMVMVIGGRTAPDEVLTDSQGRFVFLDLTEGDYSVRASKAGFITGRYGDTAPTDDSDYFGRRLRVRAGERVDVTVPVWRFGSING